jgi:ABC-2 type transport system permease protein
MVPLFSPILMPVRNAVTHVPAWQNLTSVVLLVGAIWLAAWIAGRIYRVGILMKGKRPSVPELVRWMRHG